MPWFDLLLLAFIAWQAFNGYTNGKKLAGIRCLVVPILLLVTLPLTANSSAAMRPVLVRAFQYSIENKVLAASAGSQQLFIGPWHQVLDVTTSTNWPHLYATVLDLAINLAALSFLFIVFSMGTALVLRGDKVSNKLGAALGLIRGLMMVLIFLVMIPVIVLGVPGVIMTDAIRNSWLLELLDPPLQILVRLIAPFVH